MKRFGKLCAVILALALGAVFGFFGLSSSVSALSGTDFNAGRIIDDVIFFNPYTMSPDDIQIFLNAKVPTCDTNGTQPSGRSGYPTRADWGTANGSPPPYTCLKDYSQSVQGSSPDSYCSGSVGAGTMSAAQIIYNVAQACGINPKVLIVLLQKEQSLVTDDWPWPIQYRSATGYGCPDTASCDAQYYGFFNQVYNAARAFQRYAKTNGPNYVVGRTNFIAYQANRPDCGGTNVFLDNQATAGLYNYTPYQPNQAALNNLYGTGDGCSAYGNRNFWRMFNDWFGSTYSNDTFVSHPDGALLEMNYAIFLVDNGVRRHVRTPAIFDSYGYKWSEVRRAVAGDYNLKEGMPLDVIRPGKLFRTPTSAVYVMAWNSSSSTWIKQHVTYAAFTGLGYRWDEVQEIPYAELPQGDYATPLSDQQHPTGTLIRSADDPRVFVVDTGTRRHIPRPEVLSSYHYWWSDIKSATAQDNQLPIGAPYPYRESSVLYDGGNLYITDLPPSGDNRKRPIAPWECFSDRLSYRMNEVFVLAPDALPTDTGPIIYC